MKIFSFRNIVGVAAIAGAYAYAKKHGGFKNAFDHLMKKKDELVKDLGSERPGATSSSGGYSSAKPYDRH